MSTRTHETIRAALLLAATEGLFPYDDLGLLSPPVPVLGHGCKESAPRVARLIGWLTRVKAEDEPEDGAAERLYFVSLETEDVVVTLKPEGRDRFSGYEPMRAIQIEFWRRYGFRISFRNKLTYEWDVGDVTSLIEPLLPPEAITGRQ